VSASIWTAAIPRTSAALSRSPAASAQNCSIFFSLRFHETGPMKEAKLLREKLKSLGINALIIDAKVGQDIRSMVFTGLGNATMVVIFGTSDYGIGSCDYSTKQELAMIKDDEKPFFLIKMCDRFDDHVTRGCLSSSIMSVTWKIGDPMPPDLVSQIAEMFHSLV
jgi:hypothetical protein